LEKDAIIILDEEIAFPGPTDTGVSGSKAEE